MSSGHIKYQIKRFIALSCALILTILSGVCTYGAEVTGGTGTAPAATTGATENPYAPTTVNIGNTDPRLGDSAINASMASKVKAVGEPYSVGGYTKNQLYTLGASKCLEVLTGNYGVYDKKGHRLGTAKEMFNGVWDDINPGKVIEESKRGGLPSPGGTPYNTNPGNYVIETVSKSNIKLDIPSNAVYADVQNLSGTSGGKLVELKSLSVKKWNHVARYSAVYDKDYKRVTFTRENGETY